MTLTMRLAGAASVCLFVAGCHASGAAPDARDNPHIAAAVEELPPTIGDAAGGTYWGGMARQVTLTDGTFVGPQGQRVELLRNLYATGDLEGEGPVDAVVVLVATEAGDESGTYLAVIRHSGMATISRGTAWLGHPVDVDDVRLDGRKIVLDLTRRPEGAPARPVTAIYELHAGGLVKVSEDLPRN